MKPFGILDISLPATACLRFCFLDGRDGVSIHDPLMKTSYLSILFFLSGAWLSKIRVWSVWLGSEWRFWGMLRVSYGDVGFDGHMAISLLLINHANISTRFVVRYEFISLLPHANRWVNEWQIFFYMPNKPCSFPRARCVAQTVSAELVTGRS